MTNYSMSPKGYCVCPKCGENVFHQAGKLFREETCPKCGSKMVREGSYHHQLIEEKKRERSNK